MIHDPNQVKLGKKDPGVVKHWFHDIIDVERILATKIHKQHVDPASPGWSLVDGTQDKFQMFLNDKEGDCTCACIGNLTIAQSDGKTVITDDDVQKAYVAVTGSEGAAYDPATGANDNGCVEIDVLDYWTKNKVGAADSISAHAGVQITQDQLQAAAQVFGGLYIGQQLATEQQSQQVWDYVEGSQPGSWGGHATPIVGFNVTDQGYWETVTWGATKYMTWSYVQHQIDEAHIIISPAWLADNANNPAVNQAALQAALKEYSPEK